MDQIKADLDAIEASLNAIVSDIRGSLAVQAAEHIPGVKGIVDWIVAELTRAESIVNSHAASIVAQISSGIEKAIPDAIQLVGSLIRTLTTDLDSLISNIATADEATHSVVTALKGYAPQLEKWLYDRITQSFGNTALSVMRTLELENPEAVDPILDELLKVPGLPPWIKTALQHGRERNAPIWAFLLPAVILAAILPVLGAISEPIVEAVRQEAFKVTPTKVTPESVLVELMTRAQGSMPNWNDDMAQHGYAPDVANRILQARQERLMPEIAVRAFMRGNMTRANFEGEMAQRGIDPERADTFWQASVPLLAEDNLRDLFLRHIVSEPEHDRLLGQFGYDSNQIAMRKQLYHLIPGPLDLIHMAIRNVFTPAIVERFELASDFPAPFEQAAAMQGITRDWALKYWEAHWIVPSNQEGFEMFHRTVDKPMDDKADSFVLSDGTTVHNVIGLDTMRLLLREKDTAPYYRDKLIAVAYNPLTRIDVRRMYSVGALTHAGVQRAYLDLGYSPANALRLADFVQKLYATGQKDRSRPLLDGIAKRILDLYVAEKLPYSDAAFAFADLGFTQEEADHYLAEAKMIQAGEEAQALEAGIGRLYSNSYIDEADARKRLTDAGVPDAAIDSLIRKWDLEIQYLTDKRLSHPTRDLSKAEVLDAFKAGMILEEDARTWLSHLGYPPDEADTLIGLAKFQQARDVRKLQIEAYKALYVNGTRSPLDVSNALDAMGLLVQQRDAYLTEWELLREQRTEKLPIATLRDMFKAGILDQSTVTPQLQRHRLTDSDIALLLELWGIPPKTGGRIAATVPGG
jgi:hypothetical protein